MIAKGIDSETLEKKQSISDADIVSYYFGVSKIPIRMCSPLRKDNKPSFGLYSRDGIHIYYTDFGTGDKGSIIDLLMKMWNLSYSETWNKIVKELDYCNNVTINKSFNKPKISITNSTTKIQVKTRDWQQYDVDYWNSYGISKDWLIFANVYPIEYIFFIKENQELTVVKADKLAYVFVEFKEGNVTYKVYQPLNNKGFKWFSSHDKSVISLWSKVPETGDKIVICSSLKDALCLWSNTNIPAISPQGEGYNISETAINELKRRYKNIYILYDNDNAGLADGEKLSQLTGFKNVILHPFIGGKDISDYYKITKNKTIFKEKFINLLK